MPAQLGAVDFLSPTLGVGLTVSGRPCGSSFRAETVMLAVSRDGGRHWITEGTPLPQPPPGVLVERLVATSPRTAWASSGFGPLLATVNAGSTWTVQPVPDPVVALAITRRTLWALGCPHQNNVQCHPVLARKRLPDGDWRWTPVPGMYPAIDPVLAIAAGRTIVVGNGQTDGAVRVAVSTDGGRRWRFSQPSWMGRPCWGGDLATAGPRDWWTICLGGAAAGSSAKALLHTIDAGRSWTIASQVRSLIPPAPAGSIPVAEPNALAAGSARRLWLAGFNGLSESADAGATWRSRPGVNLQGASGEFDVLSPTDAWLLGAGQGLWRTTDGRDWRAL